ncbi:MAG: HD domain-containing protein [Candidatus Cloacimonetes bacterium]|jgi:3'-5' exoribonuclease|nr:HD domain-containing protein [Candidatus Cloacimonadota bacterium]
MSKIFIKELKDHLNKEIISNFLVTEKVLREGAKDFYIRLKLADNTGSISGNVWNNAKAVAEKFDEGDVIQVKGFIITYKAQLQVNINKIKKIPQEEYDLNNFLETTTKDINKLSDKLFNYIDSIKNQYLKELLMNIFEDKEFFTRFAQSPAAKGWHHNYIGGLLEHTMSVTGLCDYASHNYNVDRDLLITGGILHDIGKVFEYQVVPNIDFTPVGRLVGHIPLGDNFIADKTKEINNFPIDLLMKLRHLILSHHGEYEKASARLPQTLEATILHQADNFDAQAIGVQQLKEAVTDDKALWTEFDRLNSRFYFIK